MSSSSDSEGPTRPKRKNYDLKFKLDAVQYAEAYNKSKAARQFKVSRTDIQRWTKQRAELQLQLQSPHSSTPAKRLQGAGRKLNDAEFDEKLINWIRQQRQKKLRVSRTTVQKQALTFSTDEGFKVNHSRMFSFYILFRLVTDGSRSSSVVTIWSHAARLRSVKRSQKSTSRRSSTTCCLLRSVVRRLPTRTSMPPMKQPSTWTTLAV